MKVAALALVLEPVASLAKVTSFEPVKVVAKVLPSTNETWHSFAIELASDLAAEILARDAWFKNAGRAMADRMPTMITTIKSSIKVNPLNPFRLD